MQGAWGVWGRGTNSRGMAAVVDPIGEATVIAEGRSGQGLAARREVLQGEGVPTCSTNIGLLTILLLTVRAAPARPLSARLSPGKWPSSARVEALAPSCQANAEWSVSTPGDTWCQAKRTR